jgi:purine-binding chemotaxis protein CheW
MNKNSSTSDLFLVFRSDSRLCALPLEHVAETMRALPIEFLPHMPPFLLGASIIRGTVVPVVNVASLIGFTPRTLPARYVTLKLGDRQIALAVDDVIGVRNLTDKATEDIPPLLSEINSGAVAAIGTLDAELLLVLQCARLIPESVWDTLDARRAQ